MWKAELLDIDGDKSREIEFKPTTHIGVRPRNLFTVGEEKNGFWESCNQQKGLGARIGDIGLRLAGRLEPFLAAEAGPSRAPLRPSGPVPAVTLEEGRIPLNLTIGKVHQADSLTPTGGRGQRAHKPRKYFGETSPASRNRKWSPHEGRKRSNRKADDNGRTTTHKARGDKG